MKKIGISAVIITKNEELNIGRCLDSLQGIADESIVVDSFSTDRTEEICRQYDIRFYQKEFADYSTSKNFGNTKAQYAYILSLDADEALSDDLRKAMIKAREHFEYDAYSMNRRTRYCGKWIKRCGWYPDRKIRLWKSGTAEWRGRIHEELDMVGKSCGHLDGDILHYSYGSIGDHLKRIDHFTDLMADDLYMKKKKVGLVRLVINPAAKFMSKYIMQGGFLEGFHGLLISSLSAYYTFCKYAKLREKYLEDQY